MIIKINKQEIKNSFEIIEKIPSRSMQSGSTLYIKYSKCGEEFTRIRLLVQFNGDLYFKSDENGEIEQFILDESKNIELTFNNIPFCEALYLNVDFEATCDLEEIGNLNILTKK